MSRHQPNAVSTSLLAAMMLAPVAVPLGSQVNAAAKQAGAPVAEKGIAILEFSISINNKVTKTNNAERALSRLRTYAKRGNDVSMTVNVNGTIRKIDKVAEAIRVAEVVARVAKLAKQAKIKIGELGPIAEHAQQLQRYEKTAATALSGHVARWGRDGDDGLGGVGGGLGGSSGGSLTRYNGSGRIGRGRVVGKRREQLINTLRHMLIPVMVVEESSASLADEGSVKGSNLQLLPDNKLGKTTLFARTVHRNYQKATFSFEFDMRDDPQNRIGNDWDLQYGNGGNHFHVAMVSDDRSRMIDLGSTTWEKLDLAKLPQLPPLPRSRREMIPAVVGHMYLVHTVDRNTDLFAVFRVEEITQKATCDISWKRIRRH